MPKVTIEVESKQYQLLKRVAKDDDSSVSRICRKVMKSYIDSIPLLDKHTIESIKSGNNSFVEPIRSGTPVNMGKFRNEFEDASEEDDDNYPPETDGKLYNKDGTIKKK